MTGRTFFIGCTHWAHANIIALANRPFGSVDEMNEIMVERWNSTVRPGDTVYHLGDFAWGKQPSLWRRRLHGKIHLILGNHDEERRLEGFEGLYNHIVDPKLGPTGMHLYHYPVEDWAGRFRGSLHLHAHDHLPELHSPRMPVVAASGLDMGDRGEELPSRFPRAIICNRFRVGAEAIDYRPIDLDEIVARSRGEHRVCA